MLLFAELYRKLIELCIQIQSELCYGYHFKFLNEYLAQKFSCLIKSHLFKLELLMLYGTLLQKVFKENRQIEDWRGAAEDHSNKEKEFQRKTLILQYNLVTLFWWNNIEFRDFKSKLCEKVKTVSWQCNKSAREFHKYPISTTKFLLMANFLSLAASHFNSILMVHWKGVHDDRRKAEKH